MTIVLYNHLSLIKIRALYPPKEISVKKIKFIVVKKSRLFERSEFLDFRQLKLIFRKLIVAAAFLLPFFDAEKKVKEPALRASYSFPDAPVSSNISRIFIAATDTGVPGPKIASTPAL
jgi:hypothetical protein